MQIRLIGLKAWIFLIIILAGVILTLLLILGLFVVFLPIILIIILGGILFSLLKRKRIKRKKDYIDVSYRVK